MTKERRNYSISVSRKFFPPEFEQLNSATVTKLGVMTPGYASPEQLQSKSVTTATDIYSLGVILYELLSGHRPFESEGKRLQRNLTKPFSKPTRCRRLQLWIWDLEFGIADLGNKAEFIPKQTKNQNRQTNPKSRKIPNPKSLSGDLDNIVLKALRKEPESRYSSAENLAEDIHRHQRGLPVTARPNTFTYRAEKFFKRNRVGVIAGGLLLLAIIGGVIATLWQSRIAAAERDRARLEAEKVQKINTYTKNILNFSNPYWFSSNPKRNRNATIAEAMDEALKNIDSDLADEPEIQAEIMLTLGQTYLSQGQYDKALKLLPESIEKFNQTLGNENIKSMQSSVMLGDAYYVTGKLDEAEKLYLAAINYFRPKVVEDKSQAKWLAIALNDYGNVCMNKGKFNESQASVRESIEVANNLTGKDRLMIPLLKSNLGTQISQTGDFKEALKYYNQALEELRSTASEQTLEGGTTYFNIARINTMLEDYQTAEQGFQKANEIFINSVGAEDVYTLQNNVHTAINFYKQGKYDEAKNLIEKTLKIQQKIYPNGHFTIAYSHRLIGSIYTKTGKLKEGETEIREALNIILKTLKDPNPEISLVKTALGENLIAQNKYAEAEELLTSALEVYVKTKGADHPATKQCRELLSKIPK